jgi:hypothetical protein
MSVAGHLRPIGDVRFQSAFHPIATKSRTSWHFGFGPTASFRTAEKQRAFSHRIIVKLITDLPIGA